MWLNSFDRLDSTALEQPLHSNHVALFYILGCFDMPGASLGWEETAPPRTSSFLEIAKDKPTNPELP